MSTNIIYHNPEEIIEEIFQKIQNHDLVFFVGSRISVREPSNLPGVKEIREETIKALCGEDFNEYRDMLNKKTEYNFLWGFGIWY